MKPRDVLVIGAVAAFLALLAASFVDVPWTSDLHEVPLYNSTSDHGVANQLFGPFTVTVILIAVLLSAAMIGGVYLAKTDE